MTNNLTLGQFIKLRRKKLGISQKSLAEKLNVSNVLISYIENGNRELKEEYYSPLSKALKISALELKNEYFLIENKKEKFLYNTINFIKKTFNKRKKYNNFGEFLKNKRRELTLSQFELSKILNVNTATISRWENNKNLPDLFSQKNLSKIFKIPLRKLYKYIYHK